MPALIYGHLWYLTMRMSVAGERGGNDRNQRDRRVVPIDLGRRDGLGHAPDQISDEGALEGVPMLDRVTGGGPRITRSADDPPKRSREQRTHPTQPVDHSRTAGGRQGARSKPRAASSRCAPNAVIATSTKTAVASSRSHTDHGAQVPDRRRADPDHRLGCDWRCSADTWTSGSRAAAIAGCLDAANRRVRRAGGWRPEAGDVVDNRAARF